MRKLAFLLALIAFLLLLPLICPAQPLAQRLIWTRVSGVDHYHLQLGRSWLLDTLIVDDTTRVDTTALVVVPGPGIYFWRLRSKAGTVWGPWSAIWDFYLCPPVAVADSLFRALRRLDSLVLVLQGLVKPRALVFRSEQLDSNATLPAGAYLGYLGTLNSRGKIPARWFRPK